MRLIILVALSLAGCMSEQRIQKSTCQAIFERAVALGLDDFRVATKREPNLQETRDLAWVIMLGEPHLKRYERDVLKGCKESLTK